MPKKHVFVEKGSAESFRLVNRSRRDVLHETGASSYVLQRFPETAAHHPTLLPAAVLPAEEAPASAFQRYFFEIDEEIAAALDAGSDEEFEELGDDFVIQANADTSDVDSVDGDCLSIDGCDVRGGEQRTLLDQRFEKLLATYGDGEVGALADDAPELRCGRQLTGPLLETLLLPLQHTATCTELASTPADDDVEQAEEPEMGQAEEPEMEEVEVESGDEGWDCESILSTCSSHANVPRRIAEPIKLSSRTGRPLVSARPILKEDLVPCRGEDGAALPARPRHGDLPESATAKRERKSAVRAERQAKRMRKKQVKLAFQAEYLQQLHLSRAAVGSVLSC